MNESLGPWRASWFHTGRTGEALKALITRVREHPFSGTTNPYRHARQLLTARVIALVGDDPTEDQIVAIAATLTGAERIDE